MLLLPRYHLLVSSFKTNAQIFAPPLSLPAPLSFGKTASGSAMRRTAAVASCAVNSPTTMWLGRRPCSVRQDCYDDVPPGELVHPRLTTVNQDIEQLGRAAASELLGLLEESGAGQVAAPRPPRLVVRESTGPAPGT